MKIVKSIVIVGGGSSGWICAAYLSKVLEDVTVTLVESKTVPRIGVGEATVPSLKRLMRRLGFKDDRSWLPSCDATIKTGISFRDWYAVGDQYWHGFEGLEYLNDKYHLGHCWLSLHRQGYANFSTRNSLSHTFFLTDQLNCREKRGPVIDTYAYHFDADKFGALLQTEAKGVRHIIGDVLDVKLSSAGDIASVLTAEQEIQGDLFIDCTGFRRRLIGVVSPTQPFCSYASSLFCNRAVVLRFPYTEQERPEALTPFVTASAKSAGWIWKIPLYSRISAGYVYSSDFLSDDDAEDELRRHCGLERTAGVAPHRVIFETGKLQQIWVRNCIAIGLSAGFVEPLESTGIAITQAGTAMLASVLDARFYDTSTQLRYNSHMDNYLMDIVHFIIAHYSLTSREDTPFWRAVRHETVIPDELSARFDVFKRLLPTRDTKGVEELFCFRDCNWLAILNGMNFPFETPNVPSSLLDQAIQLGYKRAGMIDQLRSTVGSHVEYLKKHIYGQQAEAATGS